MNEGRPYLQIWRGVWVSFCKISIVSFLSIGYKSGGLYFRMAGEPSSPTLFLKESRKKRVESREVEINIKYKINITVEKRVEIAETSGKDRARAGKSGRACASFGARRPARFIKSNALPPLYALPPLSPRSVPRHRSLPALFHLAAAASPGNLGIPRRPRAPLRRLLRRDPVMRDAPRPRQFRHRQRGRQRVRRDTVAPPVAS